MLSGVVRKLFRLDVVHRSLTVGVLKVAAGAATVLIGLILTRILTPGDFGRYSLVISLITVVSAFALCGLDQSAVRLLSAEAAGGRRPVWIAHARLLAPLSLITTAAVFLAITLIAPARGGEPTLLLAALIATWLLAAVWQRFAAESMRGNHQVLLATLFGGLRNNGVLIGLISIVAFLICWELDLVELLHIVGASSGVTVVLAVICVLIVIRSLPEKEVDRYPLGGVLAAALPLAGVTILTTSRTQLDLWLLAAVQDSAAVGLLAAAKRLVPLVFMPKMIVNGVLAPLINPRHQRGIEALSDTVRSCATLAAAPSLLVSIMLVARPRWLLTQLFGEPYSEAWLVLVLLTAAQLANVLAGSNSLTLMMLGQGSSVIRHLVLAIVVFILLGVWWGDSYSANGVAAAFLVSNLIFSTMQTLAVRRRFGIWTLPTFSLDAVHRGLSGDKPAQSPSRQSR